MLKKDGLQKDLFGNNVHVVNISEVKTYRMVKCGRCGNTVKASQAKTHLSFGNTLTICKECLKLEAERVKKKKDVRKERLLNR